MQEFIALFIAYLGFKIPWSNPYLAGSSILITLCALLYFCMAIIDRFYVRKRIRQHRIGMKSKPLNFDTEPSDAVTYTHKKPAETQTKPVSLGSKSSDTAAPDIDADL